MHVLITGGSRGIGAAVAKCVAARGGTVSFSYRSNAEAAARTATEIRQARARVFTQRADMSKEDQIVGFFEASADALGPIDGVVNNAGIVAPALPLREMTGERIARMVELNVFGALIVAREAARVLGRGGSLVNLSSAAARLGSPNEFVDYAASKGAIDTLTLGLAKELGPEGIRVNAVRPGLIDTDIHTDAGRPDRAAELGATAPLMRAGTADEVAQTIHWLLTPEASYVTGALIDVSGGR